MKKSKRNYLIIVLLVVLLALSVGYAAFSANLTINGTATATGTWDIQFASAKINDDDHGDQPQIITTTTTNDTIKVDAKLSYPGDGCTVTANIKNNGTVPAKLTGFVLTDDKGNTYSNADILVTLPTITTDGTEIIKAGATCPVTFTIKWDTDSEATSANASFKISFTYEQATEEFTTQPSHGTH